MEIKLNHQKFYKQNWLVKMSSQGVERCSKLIAVSEWKDILRVAFRTFPNLYDEAFSENG